ncbi:CLUMA_CG004965, isoform A [Clunio marinus]|uniref:CLUMA_CG004965, isoform A n=1 Tax=Clunio marinus TaxID=568069 RepID=A0A1J1HTA1_9DIPT|nr:CLUMA_CG004965, isoform A [Clunio marinus]
MTAFNLTGVSDAIKDLIDEDGVNFAGLAAKWESANDVKDLIKAINECKKLNFLNLEGNTLGCEAAKLIGEALKKHPEFKRALWKDMFTGRMKTEIPPALIDLSNGVMHANAQLTVLDLSDNALGPNGMTGLEELIKSPSCYSLKELRLMNCGLGITGAKMLAKALTHCYKKSVINGTPLQLRVFAAGRNRLENEGAKALSAIFKEIQTLEEITIPQNGIYHPGMSALSEALKMNTKMQVINFNDNTITAKGAEPLAEALYAIETLREINLGDCLLKDEGGQILSDVIADCHPNLEYLNLSGNEIGPDVGCAIANAMGHKESLYQLILDCNQFGEDGVETISEIMEGFGKLDALSIEDDEGEAEEDDEDDEEYRDDEQGEEEEEEDHEAYSDNESGGENDCIITNTSSNFSQNNFETSLDNSVLLNTSSSNDDPVVTFYNSNVPTIEKFNEIKDEDKLKSFKNVLSNASVGDDYLTHLVFAILKLSSIGEESEEAKTIAQELYKEAFEYGKNKDRIKSIRNFFLIQLGLLKSEEKEFSPKYNMKSCRSALANAIKENSLPDDEKSIFEHFLNATK